jgi:glucose/arabinose dehydrogenase
VLRFSIRAASAASLALVAVLAVRVAAQLPPPDADNGAITLPPGFRATVVADDLGPLRFITVARNGDIYVKTRQAGIIALRDTNGDGKADVKETFGSGGGTGIAVRDGWLYHSSNSAVFRYRLAPGSLAPQGEPEPIVTGLPDERQHAAKSFTFDGDGRLYVEVGSPSNAFGDPDRARGAKGKDPTEFLKKHGGFWRFDPNKPNQTQADGLHFSTGHRHALAVAWNPASKALFVVQQGRDQLNTVAPEFYTDEDNAEGPAEVMHILTQGTNLGWPFTYYDYRKKARMLAPEYGGNNEKRAEPGKFPDPLVAFPAHWSPLQMVFYTATQFPAKYRGGAFVAFHGSWNRAPKPQEGYNVTFVPFNEKGMPVGTHEIFANGFAGAPEIASPRDARFRPVGVAVGPDGSLYVADSLKGRVWRLFYTGGAQGAGAAAANGARIYEEACATCHMADGGGVPGMQPALVGSPVIAGSPTVLIDLLLKGPKGVLPARSEPAGGDMPAFDTMSDGDLAALISYVRERFGKQAPGVTAAQVAARR